ncbi:AAA family ATPase [Candidatus Sumerlaeota bacterium]|nr:AAA family ATPase [Candidatus Sumerlaeota bacterium]
MKLRNILIKNFTCFKKFSLSIPDGVKIVGIFGPNASGKTSIKDALQLLLTGKCRELQYKKDLASLIRHGESKAMVEAEFIMENKGRIIARGTILPSRYNVVISCNGKTIKLDTCFSPIFFNFLNAPTAERKKMLFDLFKRGGNQDPLSLLCNKLNAEIKSIPEGVREALAKEDFEKAQAITIELRRHHKRLIKPADEPDSLFVLEEKKIDFSRLQLNDIQKRINQLRDEQKKILEEEAKLSLYENIQTQSPDELKQKQKALEDRIKLAEEEKSHLEQQKRELEQKKQELNGKEGSLRYYLLSLESSLKSAPEKCPIYEVECKSRELIESTLTQKQEELKKQKEKLKRLNKTLTDIVSKLHHLDSLISKRKNGIWEAKRQLSEVATQLKQMKSLPQNPPSREEVQKRKADIEYRLKALTTLYEEKLRYDKAVAEYERVKKENEENSRLAEFYDRMAKALAPDGIPSLLLQGTIKPFISRIRQYAWLLGAKDITIAPDFTFFINETPEYLLSESEKFRLQLLVQEALSYLTKTRLLIIDRVDILDQANKAFFFRFLQEIMGHYDTIIFFATVSAPPKSPSDESITFLYLSDKEEASNV